MIRTAASSLLALLLPGLLLAQGTPRNDAIPGPPAWMVGRWCCPSDGQVLTLDEHGFATLGRTRGMAIIQEDELFYMPEEGDEELWDFRREGAFLRLTWMEDDTGLERTRKLRRLAPGERLAPPGGRPAEVRTEGPKSPAKPAGAPPVPAPRNFTDEQAPWGHTLSPGYSRGPPPGSAKSP